MSLNNFTHVLSASGPKDFRNSAIIDGTRNGLGHFTECDVRIEDVLLICVPALLLYKMFHVLFFLQMFKNMNSRCVKGCEVF
jgi:hypothetical protein